MGFTLRSFHLSRSTRRDYRRNGPTCRFARSVFPSPKRQAGLNGPRFLGRHPLESSWRFGRGLVCRPLDAPLGLSLPGLLIRGLAQTFTWAPLTRFTDGTITRHARRRPRVSISLQPTSPAMTPKRQARKATLIGFLHRPDPERSDEKLAGICVHLAPCRAFLPTTRRH